MSGAQCAIQQETRRVHTGTAPAQLKAKAFDLIGDTALDWFEWGDTGHHPHAGRRCLGVGNRAAEGSTATPDHPR